MLRLIEHRNGSFALTVPFLRSFQSPATRHQGSKTGTTLIHLCRELSHNPALVIPRLAVL
jgi:hypothetical protein